MFTFTFMLCPRIFFISFLNFLWKIFGGSGSVNVQIVILGTLLLQLS